LLPFNRHIVRLQIGDPVQFTEAESDADAATRLRDIVDGMWRRL
jgi:hypothetical protein